ncbi:MAG TPA: glycohydrolase toxin TNT-related protein [Candidatus Limnocylindria bacterium]|jgi:RHS repeat-associated protein|nr:glycohydrolase toxin TNT-related protein [Candidatus Limnocylindria bacterium]
MHVQQGRRVRTPSRVFLLTVVFSLVTAGLPALPRIPSLPLPLPLPEPAAAEVVSKPKYVAAAVMPNGEVGLLYANGDNGFDSAEIRFFAYKTEHSATPSIQLSTAGPAYPQLATFGSRLVAAYVDTRAANLGKLVMRASDDSGVTWSPETYPFGSETFQYGEFAPNLAASADGQTLYFFSSVADAIPQYRYTTDPTLVTWSSPALAGNASMHLTVHNDCSNSGEECYRAHAFFFMETATPGKWLYVARSESDISHSGRGTQVGTLGTDWSLQYDHGGGGGLTGCCGGSTATTFLGRYGYIYYLRTTDKGEYIYQKRSTDGGYSWDDPVYAFTAQQPLYLGAAPVGLYLPNYTRGEYIWYAGFGGTENTVRVTPLWSSPQGYWESGTVRLFGSAGGDLDAWSEFPETFGQSLFGERVSAGGYMTNATDLSLPGRKLGFGFQRWYNSGDPIGGLLGPGWTHSFNVQVLESAAGDFAEIRLGDGAVLRYIKNPDGTYLKPVGRFETLTKNGDGSFTFLTPGQTKFDLRSPAATMQGDVARDRTHFVSCSAYSDPWTQTRCEYAVDGNDPSYFLSTVGFSGEETTWGVDLSEATAVTSMRLVAGCNTVLRRYYLESSPDNSTWTVRYDSLTDKVAGDQGTLALAGGPHSARYWRVRGNGTAPCGFVVNTVVLTGAQPDPVRGKLTRISEPAGNQITLAYTADKLSAITDTVGRTIRLAYSTGTNIATGRPYTKSHEPVAWGPDTNNAELTDDILGNTEFLGSVTWQQHEGLAGAGISVTIDLGSAKAVGSARSYWGGDGNWTFPPESVDVLTSDDNSIFTLRASTTTSTREGSFRYRMDIANVNTTARYVRIKANSTRDGLFLSEMLVFERYFEPVDLGTGVGVRLMNVLDPTGRRVSYGYDGSGRLATVTDMLGNTAGQDPNLHKWTYGYDGVSRHIATVTDPDGRVRVTNTFDGLGRLDTQKDGMLNTTSYAYSPGYVVATDPRLHPTTLGFDPLGRIISREDTVVDALGTHVYSESYGYDGYGNREVVIDRIGGRTDFLSDDRGNLLTKTDPQIDQQTPRYVTIFEPDNKNNLKKVTDARGFTTENTYDLVSNVLLSTKQQITAGPPPTYALTKWEYNDAANPGLPTRVISPLGNTNESIPNYAFSQTLTYWPNGLLKERIDADGNETTFTYDDQGRQIAMVDPDGNAAGGVPAQHTWSTAYDPNDRVTSVTDPLNHPALTSYDGAGNKASATDRNGNITSYVYDNAARLWKVKQKPDPIGTPGLEYTTIVGRDPSGNATQVTQANNVVTDYGYDELNRLETVTTHPGAPAPASLTTTYLLDGNGNVQKRTAGNGIDTIYVYDTMSRLTNVSSTELPQPISYTYDPLSQRSTMTDGTGTSSYEYDGLGRLTQAIQPNGTLGYGYDLDSNRTRVTYPTVGNVIYDFTAAGRLWRLTDWGSRQSLYTYFASGLAHTVTAPGGLTTTYTYDEAQRLRTLVNATGAGTITSDIYTLDNEGNRTAIDELLLNGTFPSVKVNTDAGTTVQDHPAIAVGNELPAPATYLIWDDARDGNANIYFSRRDPVTGAWSTPNTKVNSDTGTRVQVNPAITTDSASNAYAVWEDSRDGANNKIDTNIYASTRTAADGLWGTNRKVNDDSTQNPVQRNPRIAGTAAGIETAVWVDLRASQNNIYASQLNLPGCTAGLWCPNKKVTDNTAALKDFPDVAVDSADTAYAVWQDSRGGNADIYFSSLTHLGTNWSANVKISDDPGSAVQSKPRIGVDSAGNLTAAWIDARTSPAHVRVARKPAGGSWTASIDITPTPANVQSLALSVRPDGFAWAVWGDTRAGAANQDIWGSRYDPSLNTWSAPLRLDDDPGTSANQLAPAVAFGPAETMLAWRDNRLSANGDTEARRILFIAGLTDHYALNYDGLNRLTKVVAPVAESFTLDPASNIDLRTGPTQDFNYDNANRLTTDGAQTFTWSNADRLAQRGADIFGYDALDRLTSSTVGGTARIYTYNGDGLLKSRTQGTATQFLWDPTTSPARELKQGSDNIVYGLGPLYVVKADATTVTFARDGSKNVRAELNASGAVTASFRYRAYGQLAQLTNTAPTYLGLASQLLDPSGLYYMRARWYDANSGRFLVRDPLGGTAVAPATLNSFAYAGGNPIMASDPTGLDPVLSDEESGGFGPLIGGEIPLPARSLNFWERLLERFFGRKPSPGAEVVDNTAARATTRDFAPNRGFLGEPSREVLRPGTRVDRYGSEQGTFVSPQGTSFEARSLPAEYETSQPYMRYEVVQPVEVNSGQIAPWHNQPGLGWQYELPGSIEELLNSGILRRL